MGNSGAALLASQIQHHCPSIKYLIMCGIAGGVPTPNDPETHVRLGDIVVSGERGVIQYDYGKEEADGLHPRPLPRPPGVALLRAVHRLDSAALLTGC
jgi:nucleoside phosphorylase